MITDFEKMASDSVLNRIWSVLTGWIRGSGPKANRIFSWIVQSTLYSQQFLTNVDIAYSSVGGFPQLALCCEETTVY
jgi:hypothetical protein